MSNEVTERLSKIEDKIDDLIAQNGEQNVQIAMITTILDKNTESLITHEKRTTMSEERQGVIEDALNTHLSDFNKILSFGKGAVWVLGFLFTTGFAVTGFLVKYGFIKF